MRRLRWWERCPKAFGHLHFLDRASGRRLCVARLQTQLPLLDLVGVAARAVGLDQRIGTVTDYAACQQWSRSFYEQYPDIRGIRWRGRQSGSICIVLNDRVDMTSLVPLADFDMNHSEVWPRIERAAHNARLRTAVPP